MGRYVFKLPDVGEGTAEAELVAWHIKPGDLIEEDQHIVDVIAPALKRGDTIVCDRFTDATYAYQGAGHGVSIALIDALARFVHGDCNPDLTLLFDVPSAISRERLTRMHLRGKSLDRFERETQAFFERVRQGYLARAAADPARFRIIDSTRPVADVRDELAAIVETL